MQLPFLKKNEQQKNFFLSLLIKPYKVGAILFEEINSKLFILSTKEVNISQEADEISVENLLTAADQAISYIETSLPNGSNLEKTIFSVPYDWIVDGKIEQKHLDKLKKICQDLGLTPMGYLTSIEAIVAFLDHKEGVPVSAIFVEVAHDRLFVYLVRAGKILETHSAVVEEGMTTTLNTLLKKITTVDVLPSKIILLEYDGADGAQQEFLSHSWPKEIPFLHLPQVSVLEKGIENEATINGVAKQMELEVLQDVKMVPDAPDKMEILQEVAPSDFGFMKEEDVAKKKLEPTPDEDEIEKSEDDQVENLRVPSDEPSVSYFKKGNDEDSEMAVEEPDNPPRSLAILAALPKLPDFAHFKLPKIPAIPFLSGGPAKNKLILAAAAVIALLILIAFLNYAVISKADVNVFLDKKAIDKTADITFSKNPSSGNAIKISTVDEEMNGDDTKNATGTKDTGDKATGTVLIYNKTDNSKTFQKGTVIVGPNNLEFQTQNDVSIASTSAFSTSLSSASVKIAASNFGKEYNLPSGSNFTVKGFSASDFIAKNNDATSGGSKRTTTVVSQKDLDDLLSSVTDKLAQQAVSKAKGSISGDQEILQDALASDVTDKTFNKKAGDEAGSVGVTVTIKYTIGEYSKSDLQKVVDSLSSGQVPGTYVLEPSNSKIDITDLKPGKDDSATAKLHVNAVYTPKIDPESLAKEISGKSVGSATSKIKEIVGVTDVVINFARKLPLLPTLLPFNSKNITVSVKD